MSQQKLLSPIGEEKSDFNKMSRVVQSPSPKNDIQDAEMQKSQKNKKVKTKNIHDEDYPDDANGKKKKGGDCYLSALMKNRVSLWKASYGEFCRWRSQVVIAGMNDREATLIALFSYFVYPGDDDVLDVHLEKKEEKRRSKPSSHPSVAAALKDVDADAIPSSRCFFPTPTWSLSTFSCDFFFASMLAKATCYSPLERQMQALVMEKQLPQFGEFETSFADTAARANVPSVFRCNSYFVAGALADSVSLSQHSALSLIFPPSSYSGSCPIDGKNILPFQVQKMRMTADVQETLSFVFLGACAGGELPLLKKLAKLMFTYNSCLQEKEEENEAIAVSKFLSYLNTPIPAWYKYTPFIIACYYGHVNVVQYFLSLGDERCPIQREEDSDHDESHAQRATSGGGIKINLLGGLGYSAFHLSILNNHIHLVELLIHAGADIHKKTCKTSEESCPMFLACSHGRQEIVQLLLDHGVHPFETFNARGETLLFVACEHQQLGTVQVLLNDLLFSTGRFSPSSSRWSASSKKSDERKQKIVDWIKTETKGKETALSIAQGNGSTEIVKYLRSFL